MLFETNLVFVICSFVIWESTNLAFLTSDLNCRQSKQLQKSWVIQTRVSLRSAKHTNKKTALFKQEQWKLTVQLYLQQILPMFFHFQFSSLSQYTLQYFTLTCIGHIEQNFVFFLSKDIVRSPFFR